MSVEDPTAADLGVWRRISVQHTLVHPPGMEPAREIVAAVRRFDPRYIPVWVRRTYISPTGDVCTMGYHVIGRFVRERDEQDTPVHLGPPLKLELGPSSTKAWGFTLPSAGRIWAQRTYSLGWPEKSLARRLMLPDLYLDLDWDFVTWARAAYRFMFDERYPIAMRVREMDRTSKDIEKRYLEKIQAESKYRLRQEPLKEAAQNELHKLEHPRQYTDHLPPEPKPFSDLGASNGAAL